MATSLHQRYADIFRDVEYLISDHSTFVYIYPGEAQALNRCSQPPRHVESTVQVEYACTNHIYLLHTTCSRGCIQVTGSPASDLLPPLCSSFVQRHPPHSQHSPDHVHDSAEAAAQHPEPS